MPSFFLCEYTPKSYPTAVGRQIGSVTRAASRLVLKTMGAPKKAWESTSHTSAIGE